MQLTLGEVAALLGSSSALPGQKVLGYSTDSRSIAPGQLFFALKGPRFDAHQFVVQALERGAAGAVVAQGFQAQAPPAVQPRLVLVSDTLRALQALGQAVRKKWRKPVIAVTGSTGKSTTKEMIAALLASRLRVHRSPGNLNNHIGLPLTLLDLDPRHDVAVLELATSAPGEIAQLAELVQPDVGVVTNVAPVHLQFFDSLDAIARAKHELIDYLASRGAHTTAILNFDDARVHRFAEGFPGQVITFGFQPGADFRATEARPPGAGRVAFRVVSAHLNGYFELPLPGEHNIQNALAAIATASQFNIPVADLQRVLRGFQNLHQRSEILTLLGGVTIINDSYNSSPLAMERMLETLAVWPDARRRIVVAGEMLELGPASPELHREVGRKCPESRVDWLLAVQGNARFFLEGAIQGGLAPSHARFFATAQGAGEFCPSLLEPGDVVLVKGSRAVHLETFVELLRATVAAATPASAGPHSESTT
jgi:UDP-N-acetylmuramoyl-tripeptide--D-alanyl-D-alanine ligase